MSHRRQKKEELSICADFYAFTEIVTEVTGSFLRGELEIFEVCFFLNWQYAESHSQNHAPLKPA